MRGQALIELALAIPLLLVLVSAILDGAWAFHQAGLVSAAAQEAQRVVALADTGAGDCAGAPPASYAELARRAAVQAAPGLDPLRLDVEVRYLDPACSGRMRMLAVSIGYTMIPLTPWFAPLLASRRLTAESSGVVEELPPPWWGRIAPCP